MIFADIVMFIKTVFVKSYGREYLLKKLKYLIFRS